MERATTAAPACIGSQSAVPHVRGITAIVCGARLQAMLNGKRSINDPMIRMEGSILARRWLRRCEFPRSIVAISSCASASTDSSSLLIRSMGHLNHRASLQWTRCFHRRPCAWTGNYTAVSSHSARGSSKSQEPTEQKPGSGHRGRNRPCAGRMLAALRGRLLNNVDWLFFARAREACGRR